MVPLVSMVSKVMLRFHRASKLFYDKKQKSFHPFCEHIVELNKRRTLISKWLRSHSGCMLFGIISAWLVMPGVQVTTDLGFFLHSIVKIWVKLIVLTPCHRLIAIAFLL